jgi:hypothetical protein
MDESKLPYNIDSTSGRSIEIGINKEITIKDIPLRKVAPAINSKPLRERSPKNGFEKTIAEIIEEVLIERKEPMLVKEIYDSLCLRGRNVGTLKDFSSHLISIAKAKKRFHKSKENNKNQWGLIEWRNDSGVGFNKYKALLKK